MKRNLEAVLLLVVLVLAGMAQETKKLSHSEALGAVTTKVAAQYPPVARQLRVEGTVEVEAVLAESGQVESVNIVSGNPILTKPAAEAVRKWKFIPQTQDGKPVRAIAPITMNFKM